MRSFNLSFTYHLPTLLKILLSALLCVAFSFGTPPTQAQSAEPGVYGKTLVSTATFSPELVAKFAAFGVQTAGKNTGGVIGDTVEWTGAEIKALNANSPYNIVVTVKGRAVADGDVSTFWVAGWLLEDNKARLAPLLGLSKQGLKAGETFTVSAASPTSFKEDRKVSPSVGMSRASNVEIESINVQVWQGFGKGTTRSYLMPFIGTLLGLVMLGVWFWARRR